MGSRGRLIAVGVGLFLLLVGGAAFVTGVVHFPIQCEGPPPPAWGDDPYRGDGLRMADTKEAAPYLAFTPVVPKGLDPAAANFFVGGNKPDMSARSLTLVYDHPIYWRFWIEESIAQTTQASSDAMNNNPTGCSLDSVVTLKRGTRAALMVGNQAGTGNGIGLTSIMWLDRGLLITAIGSSEMFTKDHAIAVANQF